MAVRRHGNASWSVETIRAGCSVRFHEHAAPSHDMHVDAQLCVVVPAGLDPGCVARYQALRQPFRCLFANYQAPFVTTPLFVMQSAYDSWQIDHVSDCQAVAYHHHQAPLPLSSGDSWMSCRLMREQLLTATVPAAVNGLGAALRRQVTSSLLAGGRAHGAFVDSCAHHCTDSEPWGHYAIERTRQAQAFQQWYEGLGKPRYCGDRRPVWIRDTAFPCAKCC